MIDLLFSEIEIVTSYRTSIDPEKQIAILAELNATSKKHIREILMKHGAIVYRADKVIEEEPEKRDHNKARDAETLAKLFQPLYDQGMTDAQISNRVHTSCQTVRRWRDRNQLKQNPLVRSKSSNKKTKKEAIDHG